LKGLSSLASGVVAGGNTFAVKVMQSMTQEQPTQQTDKDDVSHGSLRD